MTILKNSSFQKFSKNDQTNSTGNKSITNCNHNQTPPEFSMSGKRKFNQVIYNGVGNFFGFVPLTTIGSAVADRIDRAFQPLKDLVIALGNPIGFIMIAAGFVLVMMGQKSKGIKMIKWAFIGYIGLHFTPVIFDLLRDIATAMMTG